MQAYAGAFTSITHTADIDVNGMLVYAYSGFMESRLFSPSLQDKKTPTVFFK